MDSLNWPAIVGISLAAWAGGALWFGPLFGKLWMKIHWADGKIPKKVAEEAAKGLWKLLIPEVAACFAMVTALAYAVSENPDVPGYLVGLFVWAGFVLPTYVTATLWGNDDRKWMCAKIVLSASYRLVVLLLAGYALGAK